jgi:phenylalanyl-tRNA synthetase beta chain
VKFSYNWIREMAPVSGADPRALSRLLTMKTAECEGVEPFGGHLAPACAARVLSVEPMGDGRNRKAVVDTGRYGVKTVVCGAPNCRPGITTAYMPLEKISIGGVESDGMLASAGELGVGRDHSGVVEFEAAPGDPLPGCAADHIIEIDNKSITHRPDLWGHHGMAREVAAITAAGGGLNKGPELRDPVPSGRIPAGDAAIPVAVEDFALCPRYSALVFENATVGPSPLWLQYRLQSIGLNPINNLVDVTNFVMAEIAQPMHAFDAGRLAGGIVVRRARAGERLVALNEETYDLDPSHLVIADESGAIAIAGVIGGLPTGITPKTTRIVLESANFHAGSIRRTSARLRLRTDASMRFEKAQDPANTVRGLARAVELLEQVSPGIRLVGGLADAAAPPAPPPEIELEVDWVARRLGRAIEPAEVRSILEALEFGVRETRSRVFSVRVPGWRATRDISIKDDLVEEVGRMVGYGSIAPAPPALPVTTPPASEERIFHHRLRDFCVAQGFTEVYNYSFLGSELAAMFHVERAPLRLLNPIASDQDLLRPSLLPRIARNLADNARHFDSFRLFEIGQEIHRRPEGLPDEVPHLAAAVWSRHGDGAAGLLEVKRLAEGLMPGMQVAPAAARSFEHPSRAWTISWRGRETGRLLELHPGVVEGRAAVADLDLRAIFELGPPPKKYRPLRRFPSSSFDLSIVAGERDLVGDLGRLLEGHEGVESVEFVRVYAGAPLDAGQKSVSFRVTVGAPDRTLSSDEAGAIRQRMIDAVRAAGFDLRM